MGTMSMRLFATTALIFCAFGCGEQFGGGDSLKFKGSGQAQEQNQSNDAKPDIFNSGRDARVVRTDGLFGDGTDVDFNLSAAGIKAISADGEESFDEIRVPNVEEFTIKWESRATESCKVTAKDDAGTIIEKFAWEGTEGEQKASGLLQDTTFVLECQADNEILTDEVKVKPDGGWLQVDLSLAASERVCSTFCAAREMYSATSPEGAQCASGENNPVSARGIIRYTKGCWDHCNHTNVNTNSSYGHRCYRGGQKQDSDSTDITVGCYCKRRKI